MTDDRPTPQDYDRADGHDDERALERCPHCEVIYSPNGGYFDTVYDQQGREYPHHLDTDPTEGPFFCKRCWATLTTNERRQENRALTDFLGANGPYDDGGP